MVDWSELIQQVLAGDRAAGPMLVNALVGRLDSYAASIAPDLSQVERETAVELAVTKVVDRIDRYDPTKATLPTWARRFVLNEINEIRRSPREVPTDPAHMPISFHLRPEADDPDQPLDPKYLALETLVLQLPAADSTLLELHIHDRLTFPEIAEKLGPPANSDALRQRYRRLKRRLRESARLDPDLKDLTEETPK